ncbi:hypothetical protein BC835DRAFT_261795 [Cytidiella melzeri]|nr:hypothetical protein BC835DRAFT_261795 [Cytidiella melzeri]
MSPSTLTRHLPFPRDAPHIPTAPIPIPHVRRVTDPPPRSPTRYQASSDLIFEMSPHVTNETPLTMHTHSLVFADSDARFPSKPSVPALASRFGLTTSSNVTMQPYAEEPFLYSVPRLPCRPLQHSRTHSAIVYGSKRSNSIDKTAKETMISGFPSSFTIKSLSSVDANSLRRSEASDLGHDDDDVLTTAFQESFTSTPSSARSSVSSGDYFEHPISPPESIRNEKVGRPVRIPSILRKRSNVKSKPTSAAIRTSAAEPVVSFAQAELKLSPSSGMIARVVRSSKGSSRARSPYPPPMRGRRNSVLRTRSSKVSDDDLAGTLDNSSLAEIPGFERFLPAAFTKRQIVDENRFTEEWLERGRTRSRTRTSRRL